MSSFVLPQGLSGSVRRIVAPEGVHVSIPSNSLVVKTEVVIDDDDVELVQIWLIVPDIMDPDTSSITSNTEKTIYSRTVIYEDEEDNFEDHGFRSEIEDMVNENFNEYESGWADEYDD